MFSKPVLHVQIHKGELSQLVIFTVQHDRRDGFSGQTGMFYARTNAEKSYRSIKVQVKL